MNQQQKIKELTEENERLENENRLLYQALRQENGLTVEEFKSVEFDSSDEVEEFINNCKNSKL